MLCYFIIPHCFVLQYHSDFVENHLKIAEFIKTLFPLVADSWPENLFPMILRICVKNKKWWLWGTATFLKLVEAERRSVYYKTVGRSKLILNVETFWAKVYLCIWHCLCLCLCLCVSFCICLLLSIRSKGHRILITFN